MANVFIAGGTGSLSYDGSAGVLDVINFNSTGPLRVGIADSQLRDNPEGVLRFQLLGGDGADRLVVQQTYDALIDISHVTFAGGWNAATDGITLRDTTFSNVMVGSSLTDRFELTGGLDTVTGGDGQDTLALGYASQTAGVSSVGAGRIEGSGDEAPSVTFSGIERIDASLGSGHDEVRGLAGDDALRGGAGNDTLYGAIGNDQILGQNGNDVVYGGDGRDAIRGDAGNDFLYGDSGADRIAGGAGSDILRGGEGADELRGGSGVDYLGGGGGRDTLLFDLDGAMDTVVILAAWQSTGADRDLVRGYDGADRMVLGVRPTGISSVNAEIDAATLDADIAAAANPRLGAGGAIEAVVISVTAGTLADPARSFVVVDGNNDGSYTAGPDYLIEFLNRSGAIGLGDFVLD